MLNVDRHSIRVVKGDIPYDSVKIVIHEPAKVIHFFKELMEAKVDFDVVRSGRQETNITIKALRINNKSWVREFLKRNSGFTIKES